MFTYLVAMGALFVIAVALMILVIWAIAHTDTFFCFIKEGQGVIIKKGESFHRIIISYHGYHCVVVEEKVGEGSNTKKVRRWKIIPNEPGEREHSNGFLGFLEKQFGIYWIGIYPFRKVMTYRFRWNEWEQKSEKDGSVIPVLKHREEPTNFFYLQTFNYALLLGGAETGGKRNGEENVGGNISINAQITLLLRIVYPQVAILQNRDWFEQLGAVVLNHARLYVGSRTFEQLHTSIQPEGGGETKNEFCEHIMKLNEHAPIGADTDSIIDAFGVEIVGGVITSIELAGDSKKIADATTTIYVAEQNAKRTEIDADAVAYQIKTKGSAEADAFESRLKKIRDYGDTGLRVAELDALVKSGEKGNTIIFTDSKKSNEESERILAGILVDKNGRKIK